PIPDGLQVHPAAVAPVRSAVGAGRLAIVSDSMAAAGLPEGRYSLAGRPVTVEGLAARGEDGVLAGSVIGLDAGVRNLATFAGIPLAEAAIAATTVPRRLLSFNA